MEIHPIILTCSVKIWSDNCYSNTVNATENLAQHFVDLLLYRTHSSIP